MKFDKIWCLTCLDKERLELSKLEFNRLELDVEYYYNPMNPIVKLCSKTPFNFDLKLKLKKHPSINPTKTVNGICSCFMGHYNIIKTSYELGYNNILVFEDDCLISKNIDFNLILNYIPEDFDVINFRPSKVKTPYKKGNPFIKVSNKKGIRGNVLYALSRKYMEAYLLECEKKIPSAADYFYDKIDLNKYNFYIIPYEITEGFKHHSLIKK